MTKIRDITIKKKKTYQFYFVYSWLSFLLFWVFYVLFSSFFGESYTEHDFLVKDRSVMIKMREQSSVLVYSITTLSFG